MIPHAKLTWLEAYQAKVRQMRSTRKGTAILLVLIVVGMTLIGAITDKALAQCPAGEQCLSPAQYVSHFKAGDLDRSDGFHPSKRFAAPVWTKDYIVHKLANRLSNNKAEYDQVLADLGLTDAQVRAESSSCGTLPELCVANNMYVDFVQNSTCVPRGAFFYRSHLCAGAYGTNPITKQNVKDGIHIGICSGTLVAGVAGAPEDIPILAAGGLGFMGCLYGFLDNW